MLKTTRQALLSLTLAGTFLVSACVTRGKDFSSDLSWIRKNQTTQAEVQRLLGAPTAVGNSGGTPTWTYGFYNYRLFGESATKELKLYWTPDYKVSDFSFNSSMAEDKRRYTEAPRS